MDLRNAVLDVIAQKNDPDSTIQTQDDLKAGVQAGIRILGLMIDSSEGKFLLGDEPTLADFAVFTTIFEAACKGCFDLDAHPAIKKWYNCVSDCPAMNDLLDQYK